MFGSPPVLSLASAAAAASSQPASSSEVVHDGRAILRELQLPESSVRWFVADLDMIPRMWNAADPMYAYARRSSALVRVMEWREQFFGGGLLTEQKFLYDMRARPCPPSRPRVEWNGLCLGLGRAMRSVPGG